MTSSLEKAHGFTALQMYFCSLNPILPLIMFMSYQIDSHRFPPTSLLGNKEQTKFLLKSQRIQI